MPFVLNSKACLSMAGELLFSSAVFHEAAETSGILKIVSTPRWLPEDIWGQRTIIHGWLSSFGRTLRKRCTECHRFQRPIRLLQGLAQSCRWARYIILCSEGPLNRIHSLSNRRVRCSSRRDPRSRETNYVSLKLAVCTSFWIPL